MNDCPTWSALDFGSVAVPAWEYVAATKLTCWVLGKRHPGIPDVPTLKGRASTLFVVPISIGAGVPMKG